MISADNVAYYALISYLKLIQTHPRPFNRLTFANGSAFVSVFISTARKLTIVSRATVLHYFAGDIRISFIYDDKYSSKVHRS